MAIYYIQDGLAENLGAVSVGMLMVPTSQDQQIDWNKQYQFEPLVQLKLVGDDKANGFSHGRTMRNNESTRNLSYNPSLAT